MSDEDRLKERLRAQVASASVVADLDDVAARIGAGAHRRGRPLALAAVATLIVGTLGGFAVGRVTRATTRSVTVTGTGTGAAAEQPTTTAAVAVDQGGSSQAVWSLAFVRTTADGVTIRAFLDPNASPADLHLELSTPGAVSETSQPNGSAPVGAIRGLGGGVFGISEGAPAQWAFVSVGPGVSLVRAAFGNDGDEMQPVHGIAVLAHVGTGPITVSALDAQGKTLETKTVGNLCVDACSTPTTIPPLTSRTLPAPGAEQPPDVAAARQAVSQAVSDAFEGSKADPTMANAIEGGDALTSVFDALRTGSFARQVTEAKTVVDGIVFLSASSAAMQFHSNLGADGNSGPYFANAALTAGGWQVTRASYCQIIVAAAAHCP